MATILTTYDTPTFTSSPPPFAAPLNMLLNMAPPRGLPEDQQRAAEAGFDQHVAKPPRMDKLEELLSSLGERSSSAQ